MNVHVALVVSVRSPPSSSDAENEPYASLADTMKPVLAESTINSVCLRTSGQAAPTLFGEAAAIRAFRNGQGLLSFPTSEKATNNAVPPVKIGLFEVNEAEGTDRPYGFSIVTPSKLVPGVAPWRAAPLVRGPGSHDVDSVIIYSCLPSASASNPAAPSASSDFQISLSLLSVKPSSSSSFPLGGIRLVYELLDVRVESGVFDSPSAFAPIRDAFQIHSSVEDVADFLNFCPVVVTVLSERDDLLGVAVASFSGARTTTTGHDTAIATVLWGSACPLSEIELRADVSLMVPDSPAMTASSPLALRRGSASPVPLVVPHAPAALPVLSLLSNPSSQSLTQQLGSIEQVERAWRERLRAVEAEHRKCAALEEKLLLASAQVEKRERAVERAEEAAKAAAADRAAHAKVLEKRFNEELEHRLGLEKLKQEQLTMRWKDADEASKRLQGRLRRVEAELAAVRDAYAKSPLGRSEIETAKARGEIEDLRNRLLQERRDHATALRAKDERILLLTHEVEALARAAVAVQATQDASREELVAHELQGLSRDRSALQELRRRIAPKKTSPPAAPLPRAASPRGRPVPSPPRSVADRPPPAGGREEAQPPAAPPADLPPPAAIDWLTPAQREVRRLRNERRVMVRAGYAEDHAVIRQIDRHIVRALAAAFAPQA